MNKKLEQNKINLSVWQLKHFWTYLKATNWCHKCLKMKSFQYSSLWFEHKVLDDFWLPSVLVFFKILSDIFNVFFFYLEQFQDLRVKDLYCLWTDKISKIGFCCSCMKFTEKKLLCIHILDDNKTFIKTRK